MGSYAGVLRTLFAHFRVRWTLRTGTAPGKLAIGEQTENRTQGGWGYLFACEQAREAFPCADTENFSAWKQRCNSIMRFPGIILRKLGFGEVVVMQGVIRYFGARGLTAAPTTKTCFWGPRKPPQRRRPVVGDPGQPPQRPRPVVGAGSETQGELPIRWIPIRMRTRRLAARGLGRRRRNEDQAVW